jgi:hypothetical protein
MGIAPMRGAHHGARSAACTANCPTNSQLYYQDGSISRTLGVIWGRPRVYIVYWGSQWGTQGTNAEGDYTFSGDQSSEVQGEGGMAPYQQDLFRGLGTGGETWSGVMTQYCAGLPAGSTSCPAGNQYHVGYPTGGALAGVWYDNSAPAPTNSNGNDIANEAIRAAEHFGNDNAGHNLNNQYIITSPPGIDPAGVFAKGDCAWHSSTVNLPWSVSSYDDRLSYTNMPYILDKTNCTDGATSTPEYIDGVSIFGGHEYAESLTDAYDLAGWCGSGGCSTDENGDKCMWGANGAQYQQLMLSTGTFKMEQTWGNDGNGGKGGCEFTHPVVTNPGGSGGTLSVSSDQSWNDLFQRYGDTSGGWSGGDGAQSVQLPAGDTAWFFGDTYLGGISPDGTHGPLSTGVAHNTSVLYSPISGTLGAVSAAPPGGNGYQWNQDYTWVGPPSGYPATRYELINGDQVFDNGTLYKFYQLADRNINPGGFQYKLVGTVMESFSVNGDTLTPGAGTPIGVQDSSGSNPVIWGTAVLTPGDGYIYIYGTEPYNANPPSGSAYPLYVARVPVGSLSNTAAWQYYAAAPGCNPPASAWSSNAGAATALMPGGTSAGFSVTNVNGTYVLLTNDSTGTYNNAVAYYASCPTGFSASSPKHQVYAPSVPAGYLTYEYRVVPQFSNGSNLLVSYSQDTTRVDASCMGENYYDSSIYRPRFLDVTLPGITASGGPVTHPPDNAPPGYTAPVVSPDPMYKPTDSYPGTSTPASQFCAPGATPTNSPALTVTGNSNDVIGLSWSLQPTAMWMYSVVYCDVSYYGTACPSNLAGPQGNNLTNSIPACSNQAAPNTHCGFNLSFGNTTSTLTSLIPGDTYEIQIETTLAVEGGQYVGSNAVTQTAT